MNQVIWLTGQSGAGKTTIAKELQKEFNCVILDGDEMRSSISLGAGFSREDRTEHNLRVARLANVLAKQTLVIVSVIAPIAKVRKQISKICLPTWIYIKRTIPEREGHFYEEPENYSMVDHDKLSIKESVEAIKEFIGLTKEKYSVFIGRWQPLHDGHKALFDKVRKEGKKIAIGIRDTPISESDPYSVRERMDMIEEQVPDAECFIMPDLEEVVYGRGVGWGIREIHLDKKTEAISATKIRKGKK